MIQDVELNISNNSLGAGGAAVMENALPGVKCVSRFVYAHKDMLGRIFPKSFQKSTIQKLWTIFIYRTSIDRDVTKLILLDSLLQKSMSSDDGIVDIPKYIMTIETFV